MMTTHPATAQKLQEEEEEEEEEEEKKSPKYSNDRSGAPYRLTVVIG